MDRTILNVVSVIVGGAGLFTVLTGFNVPEASQSFFGDNPFQIKRDVIQTSMEWIFTLVALCGLVIQLWAEIWENDLPERLYTDSSYARVALVAVAVAAVVVWWLSIVGRSIARRRWLPRVVEAQRDLFNTAADLVENDGLRPQEVREGATFGPGALEKRRQSNLADLERHLSQMERLFDVTGSGPAADRIERLRPLFLSRD